MISRSWSAYSSMIRRASSERDSLGGGSSLPNRGLSDGFMARRSAHDQGEIGGKSNATIRRHQGG